MTLLWRPDDASRFWWFRFDIGPTDYISGRVNYSLKVLDGRYVDWHLVPNAYGQSDAINDDAGAFTELAIGFEGRNIKVTAGGETIVDVPTPEIVPNGMRYVALVVEEYGIGDRPATGLFDWIDVFGHEKSSSSNATRNMAHVSAAKSDLTAILRRPMGQLREVCWNKDCP